MESNAIRYFCITSAGLGLLNCLLITTTPKVIFLATLKTLLHQKVKLVSLVLKKMPLLSHISHSSSVSVNNWENKVVCITYLKKSLRYFVVNLKVLVT